MPTYYYGSFVINDGVHYFLQQKSFDLPQFKQTTFAVARLEGVKKTGERLDNKQLPVTIKVVGSSRADLEAKLDALYQALSLRQQSLILHAADNRYYVADAIAGTAQLAPGRVLAVEVPVTFNLLQPFAYAPAQSGSITSSLLMTAVTGAASTWQLPSATNPINVSGGGNYFSRPVISITNNTAANATTLTANVNGGTAYTSLSVAALPAAATSGQIFLLVNGSGQVQRVTLSANALLGATTLSVVSFTPVNSFASGSFCGLDSYLQGFTLSQDPDGTVLTVTGLGAQQVGHNLGLIVSSDATTPTGETVMLSSATTPLAFTGAFPVLEPTTTQFSLQVVCSNQPTISFQVTWIARWLA